MTFAPAFDRSRSLVREARRLFDLGYRWNVRFRLWEHASDPGVALRAARLDDRMHAARGLAEDAEHALAATWDRWSRALPPRQSVGSFRIAGAGGDSFRYAPIAHASTEGGFAL
jgi:hypothetical protein